MKTDVLVVGAGPVGLVMAAELARYGVGVRVVEKAARRTDKSKALVVWSRTLELLARAGCAETLVGAGQRMTAGNVFSDRKQIAHLDFSGVDSPYAYGLMLPQSETERVLEEHLNGLGVKVEREVELTAFTAAVDGVTATLKGVDGTEETVQAGWMLGCDGAHSTVRHGLGMEFTGDTLQSDWVLADVHLTGLERADEVNVFWHKDGVLVTFPITETRFRVIADGGVAKGNGPRPDPTMAEVQALLDERGPGGVTVSDPIWLAAFRINERKVKEYRAGRVFLAGDAAHVHSPAGGQGMNTGIQDACNLAWKLGLVVKGTCSGEALLGSYSPERSAVGEMVLKAAGRTTEIAIMKGEWKQAVRDKVAHFVMGFGAVREKAAEAATELSIAYEESPLNGQNGGVRKGPKVGERAPVRAGERPVGAGREPKFVVFGDGEEVAREFPELVEAEVREPFAEGGIWLVRPDGYVAITAKVGEDRAVARYLEGVRGWMATERLA